MLAFLLAWLIQQVGTMLLCCTGAQYRLTCSVLCRSWRPLRLKMMFLIAFVGILRLLREDMPSLVQLMFQSLREWCLSRPSRLLGPPPRGRPWALEKGRGAAAEVIDPLEHHEHCCCQIVITGVKGDVLVGKLPPLREARLLRFRFTSRLTLLQDMWERSFLRSLRALLALRTHLRFSDAMNCEIVRAPRHGVLVTAPPGGQLWSGIAQRGLVIVILWMSFCRRIRKWERNLEGERTTPLPRTARPGQAFETAPRTFTPQLMRPATRRPTQMILTHLLGPLLLQILAPVMVLDMSPRQRIRAKETLLCQWLQKILYRSFVNLVALWNFSVCAACQVLLTSCSIPILLDSQAPNNAEQTLLYSFQPYRPETAWSAPRPRGRSASRSGPKSRGCSFTAVGTLLFLTLFLLGITGCTATADARVSGLPTESLGAEVSISAKPCGEPSHVWRAADLPASRKRSFRRAVRRAALHGSTFYRGKQFSSRGLEHIRNNTTNSSFSQRATSNDYVRKRLRILSVNFDGMTTAVYDSFTLWLQTAPYDIVLMQETHRGFGADFAEWQAGAWIFISSPDDKSRFAGVAVAIRTSLATKHTVRSLPVIPGRILHVRLSGCRYSIDVISCYQHVINSRVTQAVNSSRREHFWTSLGRYLAALPFRNMLVVAGDFNCAARREDGVAGFAAPSPNSYYFDQDDFIGLAVANSLCLLNTWSRPRSQDMNTFANGSLSSQIDYVMTRKSAADSLARQSRPVPGLDFAPWRLGSKHLPVQASIRMRPGWLATSSDQL